MINSTVNALTIYNSIVPSYTTNILATLTGKFLDLVSSIFSKNRPVYTNSVPGFKCLIPDQIDPQWNVTLQKNHPGLVQPYRKFMQLETEYWPTTILQQRKIIHKDLEYLSTHQKEPFYEKMVLNFIRNHAPAIETHLQLSWIYPADIAKKTKAVFENLKANYLKKSYRITREGEGLYGRMIPRIDIVPEDIPFGIDFAKNNQNLCHRDTTPVAHKEEADYLVQVLSRIDELSSRYKFDYCDVRAIFIYQLLLYMGVPKNDLQKITLNPPKNAPRIMDSPRLFWNSEDKIPRTRRSWGYHIAILLTTANGEKLVIDPSTNPERALTIPQWALKAGGVKEEALSEKWVLDISDPFHNNMLFTRSFTNLYENRFLGDLPYNSKLRKLFKEAFNSTRT